MDYDKNVGDLIRDRMDVLGWNVKVSAKRIGMNYAQLSNILRGEITDPRMFTIARIAKGLHTSVDSLIPGFEDACSEDK